MDSGDYFYIVEGNGACPADSAVVSVTEVQEPDAGTDASLAICSNGMPVNMIDQLGGSPDYTGSWIPAIANNTYDPPFMLPGVYRYVVGDGAICASDTSTLTITEDQARC